VNASFAYDALGRRVAKTIEQSSLGFVYDGGGIAQELSGTTVNCQYLERRHQRIPPAHRCFRRCGPAG
jgi:hypothetical protein